MFDHALLNSVAYATTLRYNGVVYQWGAAARGLCVCALWVALAWFPSDSFPRAPVQLLLVTGERSRRGRTTDQACWIE